MEDIKIMIRCGSCLALNRVLHSKIESKPVCGSCKSVLDFPRQPLWAKAESYDFATSNWPETLLVVFTAPMCVYCKIVEPLLVTLAKDRAGMLKIMKVDTEADTLLAKRFKIQKTPTFIVYKNGEQILRVDGAPKDKSDLTTWIDNLMGYKSAES
jgi:thioredoxin 2